jgi:CRISPR/Cas system-associated protein Csm6
MVNMKYLISTVGTSLFTNFNLSNNLLQCYNRIDNGKFYKDRLDNRNKYYISQLSDDILKRYGFSKKDNDNLTYKDFINETDVKYSAEIESIVKIFNKYYIDNTDEDIKICFITSDSITSNLAAKLIDKILKDRFKLKYSSESFIANGLNHFNKINKDIITSINNIIKTFTLEKYKHNSIINISGGYKVFNPPMRDLSVFLKAPIVYMFDHPEENNDIIELEPRITNIDEDILISLDNINIL